MVPAFVIGWCLGLVEGRRRRRLELRRVWAAGVMDGLAAKVAIRYDRKAVAE